MMPVKSAIYAGRLVGRPLHRYTLMPMIQRPSVFKSRRSPFQGALAQLCLGLGALLLCGSHASAAATATSASVSTDPTWVSTRMPLESVRPVRHGQVIDELSIEAHQDSYLDRTHPPAQVSDYSMMSAHLRTRTENPRFNGVLDFGGTFATTIENYSNFEVPEASLIWLGTQGDSGREKIVIGRHLEEWSRLDSEWNLGLWQPLNRFDYLNTKEQGLTGLFAGWKRPGFEILAFYSNIFIPEQGSPYELSNGSFRTFSPWFSEPTDRLILFDKTTRVNYDVVMPTVGSVISQHSYGGLIRLGRPDGKGGYLQLAGMRKPRNQIALPFAGHLQIEPDNHYASVTVYPRVEYHTIGSLDVGYRLKSYGFGVAALSEKPDQPEASGDLNYQILEPMTMVSPYAEFRLFKSRLWGPRVRLSALHTWGGNSRVEGPITSNGDVFAARTIFREAASLSVDTILARTSWGWVENSFRWIEEFAEQGTLLSTDFRAYIGANWSVNLGADFLGSRQPVDETHDFISRYRGNDRVSGGVTFVF